MGWVKLLEGDGYVMAIAEDYSFIDIPAWSLGRLIEIVCNGQTIKGEICSDIVFDELIDCIKYEIKEGHFNKEYLV